jgi:DNA-binding NarL/FixJ family response regulator
MKLLLVDDHPLFNAGLAMTLLHACNSAQPTAQSQPLQVQTATTLREGISLAATFGPDMVLLDYHMRGSSGTEVLQAFGEKFPWIARVVISGDERSEVAALARVHGASGFISKTLSIDQVWQAIKTIASGAEWWEEVHVIQPHSKTKSADGSNNLQDKQTDTPRLFDQSFTLRQLEVLRLLSEGLNNRDIAQTLFISERTVKQHVSDMLTKSGAANRVQLLNAVRSRGLLM